MLAFALHPIVGAPVGVGIYSVGVNPTLLERAGVEIGAPLVESSEQLRARIPGWGVDLDPKDRPSVPKLQYRP